MENLSALFWDKLNDLIGSKEVVHIRRAVYERVKCLYVGNGDAISSGSRAEGLDLQGSDTDMMLIDTSITVKTQQCSDISVADLIMETENLKPGFTKLFFGLKWGSILAALNPRYSTQTTSIANSRAYFSSLSFRNKYVEISKKTHPDSIPHGPCATYTIHGQEFDDMHCLSCAIWPIEASEWRHRQRVNNWPSSEMVSDIINNGILLVPIGNPLSQTCNIEWRISFSLAEKKLVHSFNHTQLMCYGLLKLYLKHVIDLREDCKGLICSYFLKTALFYCIEDSNIVWEKHNFLECFWVCFRRLFLWIREGFCPNYFIRTNNMFESKIYGENQTKLKEHFFNLYEQGIDALIKIPVLSIVHYGVLASALGDTPNRTILNKINEFECDKIFFNNFHTHGIIPCNVSVNITRTQGLLQNPNISPVLRICYLLQLDQLQALLIQQLYHGIVSSAISNKIKYKQLHILSRYILRNCTESDICTGWLQYATLCYLTGNYTKVISVIPDILDKFGRYIYYLGHGSVYNRLGYIEQMCGKGYSLQHKLKHAVARSFSCIQRYGFYPEEIEDIVKQHVDSLLPVTDIPPQVYAFVLLFLAYHRTGKVDFRQKTLDKLLKSSDTFQYISEGGRPVVAGLIQRCVELTHIPGNRIDNLR